MPNEGEVYDALAVVLDPEVPVLSVVELGIVRGVRIADDGITIDVTPTYSGCPAMRVIEEDIVAALDARGWPPARVRTVFAPAWTTDWMTDAAKDKLRASGIAPPGPADTGSELVALTRRADAVACPYCGSTTTERRSAFGSTACKAIHFCNACRQPFEEFKAI